LITWSLAFASLAAALLPAELFFVETVDASTLWPAYTSLIALPLGLFTTRLSRCYKLRHARKMAMMAIAIELFWILSTIVLLILSALGVISMR
jgi:hypothetical protein